jgi:hypothetical protein
VELRHEVLTIPSAAMQRGQDGIYAWVLMPGDVVQVRMIESGPTTGDQTIITSGLSQGTASFSTARASPTASPGLCVNRATLAKQSMS